MRRIRNRLTYANVMSTLALVLALGGGVAYAANTVFSSDIVNGEVKSPDIGTDEVRSVDVRDDLMTGGGLSGADIRESTLGKVPNANKLDGLDSSGLVQGGGKVLASRFILPYTGVPPFSRTIFEIPGFGRLDAFCGHDNAEIHLINTTNQDVDVWTDGVGPPRHLVVHSSNPEIVVYSPGSSPPGAATSEAATVALGFGDDPGARKTATVHAFVSRGPELPTDPCIFQAQGMLWTGGTNE
jgi:hypothetical protein